MNHVQSTGAHLTTETADRGQRAELARAARREEILDAARRVFAERGFRGTTIADIAEGAGIALGTIYLYFPSKEDVFAALHQRLGELITSAISEGGTGTGTLEANVRGRVNRVFEVCAANRDLVQLVVLNTDPESAATRRIRAAEADRYRPVIEGFERLGNAGVVRKSDARVMTHLIFGLVSIAVYQAFVLSDGSNAEVIRDECADMVIAYLMPDSPRHRS